MVVGAVEAKSPAAEAGLVAGDVITAVDDTEIQRPLDFQRAMLDRKPGQQAPRWRCAGPANPLSLNLTLGEAAESRTQSPPSPLGVAGRGTEADPARGVPPEPPDPLSRRAGGHGGSARQPRRRPRHLPGDVLVGMHIWETVTLDNVAYILKRPDFADLNPVKFFILRGDETLYGYLPLPPAKTAQR